MQKTGILFGIMILLASCNSKETSNKSLVELQNQKEVVKKQLDSLAKKMKLIDEQIKSYSEDETNQIVTTLNANTKNFEHFIEVYGNVKAEKNVEIHPEFSGVVTQIYVKEGQQVSKGQTLLQFDASQINSAVDELKTRLDLATTSFERQERLWNQKIGSEMQYLQAKNQKESLEKLLVSLKIQANKMRITAPFSGVIDYIYTKVGELTGSQNPVIRLVNLQSLYLEADVTESHLIELKIGTPVHIVFPSIKKEMKAAISNIGNIINPENRSFKVRIDISNNNAFLKPNLFANIKINDFSRTGIVLPLHVIQKDKEGNSYVYVAQIEKEQVKVVKKQVAILSTYNNEVLIGEGLQENDQVIDKGSRIVNEGNSVTVKSE
ncbi:MAG: efflux RND transporter periplasmic adaptor subunit [Flavobacteriaceae bacterium]|nr:efflux RND transporter periplasmic adaptor subunit [Flavobacteriaceae bacterium]